MKAILSLTAIALFVLAACAGQPQNSGSQEVKFGWIGPLSGDVASIGVPIKDAAVLAVDEINQKNLLNGKKLTLVFEDDQCDPKKSVTAVQKLIGIDAVVAISGGFCSGTTLADAPIAEQNKVILMSPSSTNPKIKDAGDYIFRVVPPDSGQGATGASIVKSSMAKRVAVLQINNDWGEGMAVSFIAESNKKGLEIVAHEKFDSGSTDLRVQITKIKAENPEAVYLIAHPAETALALKQSREVGLKVGFVGADGSKDDAVISGAGSASEGFTITVPGVPESPELEAFNAAYKAKYNKNWQPYTPEGYDVVMILAKACAATDCTSPAMKDYLYKMGPYKGASGTFEFDNNGEVQKNYDLFEVRDGKWKKVWLYDEGGLTATS